MHPPIETNPDYKKDATSGLAVFLVAVPLCLGIAHASGAPLLSGLLSGIIGGILTGSLSGSHLSVTGPAAGLTTIILSATKQLGSYQGTLVAVFLAGVLQLVFGKLRLGSLSRLFPSSVIHGMLSAIGLILISKQFPHMVGYDREQMGVEEFAETQEDLNDDQISEKNTLSLIRHSMTFFHQGSLVIGSLSLAILVLWDKKMAKRFPSVPASLVAVIFAVSTTLMFKYGMPAWSLKADHLVQIPALSKEAFTFPDFSVLSNYKVYLVAITIALVASLESLLSLDAIDRLDPRHRFSPPNKELVAQGAGNCLSALVGGLPVTAVIVRGSVNLNAGATSKFSAIFHGIYLLLSVLFLRDIINLVPLSALAAVLVYTGFKLAHPSAFRHAYHAGWSTFVPFVVTTFTVLFTDLLMGIGVGLATSAFFVLKNLHLASGFDIYRNRHHVKIRLHQEVTFFHKSSLGRALEQIEPGAVVEIDGSKAISIDPDVIDSIKQFMLRAERNGIQVFVGGIPAMLEGTNEFEKRLEDEMNDILNRNQHWSKKTRDQDPEFFSRQHDEVRPRYLFVVCADSLVPPPTFTQTAPGDIMTYRNIGQVISAHDPNFMAVLQYCVDTLNIHHIVVCGHYGCDFVTQVLSSQRNLTQLENWLWPIGAVLEDHKKELANLEPDQAARRLSEIHTVQQASNLLGLPVIKRSRERLGIPRVHAWVYDEDTGEINKMTRESSGHSLRS